LWVDAVCINQKDTTERNRQVSNMIWIYSMTGSVIIWLGESVDQGERCLLLNKWLGRERLTALRTSPRSEDLEGLQRFFKRGWFSRRWVIQEAAVA
ncbi:hypothetical protein AOQ84DRAFT_277192, partial [Glonium stellatum]